MAQFQKLKILGIARKHFDLRKSRNKYDLMIPSANSLFDGDLTTKPMKNELIKEVEKLLSLDDYNFEKEKLLFDY